MHSWTKIRLINSGSLSAGHKSSGEYHQIGSLESCRDIFVCACLDAFHSPPLSFCVCVSFLPHTQDEETIPVELRNLPEYKELLELKRLKKQTLQEIREDKVGMRHVGYKVKIDTQTTFTATLLHMHDL